MKFLLFIPLLCLSCEKQSEADARTKANFQSPQTVGTLPDGRVVKCVIRGNSKEKDHYIYFVDNTITVNHEEPSGKTTIQKVEVFIDGVKFVAAEKQ